MSIYINNTIGSPKWMTNVSEGLISGNIKSYNNSNYINEADGMNVADMSYIDRVKEGLREEYAQNGERVTTCLSCDVNFNSWFDNKIGNKLKQYEFTNGSDDIVRIKYSWSDSPSGIFTHYCAYYYYYEGCLYKYISNYNNNKSLDTDYRDILNSRDNNYHYEIKANDLFTGKFTATCLNNNVSMIEENIKIGTDGNVYFKNNIYAGKNIYTDATNCTDIENVATCNYTNLNDNIHNLSEIFGGIENFGDDNNALKTVTLNRNLQINGNLFVNNDDAKKIKGASGISYLNIHDELKKVNGFTVNTDGGLNINNDITLVNKKLNFKGPGTEAYIDLSVENSLPVLNINTTNEKGKVKIDNLSLKEINANKIKTDIIETNTADTNISINSGVDFNNDINTKNININGILYVDNLKTNTSTNDYITLNSNLKFTDTDYILTNGNKTTYSNAADATDYKINNKSITFSNGSKITTDNKDFVITAPNVLLNTTKTDINGETTFKNDVVVENNKKIFFGNKTTSPYINRDENNNLNIQLGTGENEILKKWKYHHELNKFNNIIDTPLDEFNTLDICNRFDVPNTVTNNTCTTNVKNCTGTNILKCKKENKNNLTNYQRNIVNDEFNKISKLNIVGDIKLSNQFSGTSAKNCASTLTTTGATKKYTKTDTVGNNSTHYCNNINSYVSREDPLQADKTIHMSRNGVNITTNQSNDLIMNGKSVILNSTGDYIYPTCDGCDNITVPEGYIFMNSNVIDLNGTTNLKGNTNIINNKSLTVSGTTTLNGNTTVSGTTTLKDNVSIDTGKSLTVGGTTTLKDNVSIDTGKSLTVGGTTTLKDNVSIDTGKSLTVGGTTTLNDNVLIKDEKKLYFGTNVDSTANGGSSSPYINQSNSNLNIYARNDTTEQNKIRDYEYINDYINGTTLNDTDKQKFIDAKNVQLNNLSKINIFGDINLKSTYVEKNPENNCKGIESRASHSGIIQVVKNIPYLTEFIGSDNSSTRSISTNNPGLTQYCTSIKYPYLNSGSIAYKSMLIPHPKVTNSQLNTDLLYRPHKKIYFQQSVANITSNSSGDLVGNGKAVDLRGNEYIFLNASDAIEINGTTRVNKDGVSSFNVGGTTTLNGNTTVGGHTSLQSSLGVGGTTSFGNNVSLNKNKLILSNGNTYILGTGSGSIKMVANRNDMKVDSTYANGNLLFNNSIKYSGNANTLNFKDETS